MNKWYLVIPLFFCLCDIIVAQDRSQATITENDAGSRRVVSLNTDWKFIREDVPGADKPDFDDSKWQDVGLPHCYNDQDTFDKIAQEAKGENEKDEQGVYTTNSGDGGWNGKTWYRKRFKLNPSDKGLSAYLEIEAARTVAQVWLNGKFLGKYVSGFSSFAFDVTQDLLPDGENVLAIQVDDTEGTEICAGNWSHWQPVLGGLYRNVRLHLMNPLHVTLPYYSFLKTEGVYFGVTNLTPLEADFRMTTEVANGYDQETSCEVAQEAVDADGTTVLKLPGSQKIAAHGIYKFDQSGKIAKPHKWSVDDPYLYQVVTTVQKEGKIVDRITTPMGIRTIGFDHVKRKFLLNGKPLLLTGYGQKPDEAWPGLGSALPDWLIENDIKLMKDCNGNIVRWGHCAGPVPALDAGDRIGFMNWQPNLSGESDYKGEVWKNKVEVMRDLIIRDRNHPSLVIWEGNNRDLSLDHTKEIRDVVNQWDWIAPRPCAERGPYSSPEVAALQSFSMGMNGADYIKTLCGIEAEYYRPESPRRCWDDDNDLYPPPPVQNSYFKTQQEACREFLKKWVNIASHGGGVKWHLTDDTTHMRLPGYAVARLSGAMDATRLPKDMYGALRVIFADETQPDIHLMGHWNYEEKKVHTVDVYSTCDTVELFVNGTSLGKKTPENRFASWENVPFAPGKLKAVGYNGGSPDASDERVTARPPARLKLECLTNPKGMRADRSDVAIVTATVEDKDGNWHPLANPPITFSVSGPGNYRGGFNDYLPGTTGKTTLFAEAGKIRISVRSTNQPGKVTVTATSDGLEPASISFDVLPVGQ
jgi:beta-galactosidase